MLLFLLSLPFYIFSGTAQAETTVSENLIPKMTSDTAPSGKVTSSSKVLEPFLAFDGVPHYSVSNTFKAWGTHTQTGWLGYEFDTPKILTKYILYYGNHQSSNPGYMTNLPNSWTFEGSNDGVNWTKLDSVSNYAIWQDGENVFEIDNKQPFTHFRINITKNNGSTSNVVNLTIHELELWGYNATIEPNAETISLDKYKLELVEGNHDKLTATVLPENIANKKIIWTSSDESITTVDQDGNVIALREGEAIITAKVENTDLVAICTVIVKKLNNEYSSAILSITLVNGITKEYDVTNKVLNNYLNWFENAQGTSTFKFSKTLSPYKKVTEYIVHDKITSFEVREY
ncbi:Ig-like domain-containing protein [Viridibacillus sp. YIM B01967]|uniref:Ig-like domain-containing protein n=2 Tax=Viridibacillus soli TaxID=2798301 RepID=A0ABS1H356_9BACL|nr:Ig-like domain-containing protein [Viridibacillus soli]